MASKHFSQIDDLFDEAAETSAATAPAAAIRRDLTEAGILPLQVSDPSPDDPFDYDSLTLSNDKRATLKDYRQRIVAVLGAAVIAAGQDLLKAKQLIKEQCPRGTWSIWLKSSLGVSESTARNYMAAAEWAAKTPTVGEMAPGAMYLGATAPTEVQAAIVQQLDQGKSIKADEIKQMIVAHRQAASSDLAVAEGEDRSSVDNVIVSPEKGNELVIEMDDGMENAARELLARLREQFDDSIIAELLNLFGRTSIAALRKVLIEGRSGF